jgi:hypothetical protein
LAIDWGIAPNRAILSEKDHRHPRLADLPQSFFWTVSAVRSQGAS